MLDYTKLKLSHNKMLVRPLAASELAAEGSMIVRPEETRDSLRGIVVAKGPGALNDRGERVPIDTPIGALVFFGKYAGLELADGCGYIILADTEAIGWLEPGQRQIVIHPDADDTIETIGGDFVEVVHDDFRKNHLEGDGCEICREAGKQQTRDFLAQQRSELGISSPA